MKRDPFILTTIYALVIYALGVTSIFLDAPMTVSLVIFTLGLVLTIVIWETKATYDSKRKSIMHQNGGEKDVSH